MNHLTPYISLQFNINPHLSLTYPGSVVGKPSAEVKMAELAGNIWYGLARGRRLSYLCRYPMCSFVLYNSTEFMDHELRTTMITAMS